MAKSKYQTAVEQAVARLFEVFPEVQDELEWDSSITQLEELLDCAEARILSLQEQVDAMKRNRAIDSLNWSAPPPVEEPPPRPTFLQRISRFWSQK
jgi:hypothetical protein